MLVCFYFSDIGIVIDDLHGLDWLTLLLSPTGLYPSRLRLKALSAVLAAFRNFRLSKAPKTPKAEQNRGSTASSAEPDPFSQEFDSLADIDLDALESGIGEAEREPPIAVVQPQDSAFVEVPASCGL